MCCIQTSRHDQRSRRRVGWWQRRQCCRRERVHTHPIWSATHTYSCIKINDHMKTVVIPPTAHKKMLTVLILGENMYPVPQLPPSQIHKNPCVSSVVWYRYAVGASRQFVNKPNHSQSICRLDALQKCSLQKENLDFHFGFVDRILTGVELSLDDHSKVIF